MSALYLSSAGGRVAVRGDARYRLANTQTYSEWLWDGTRLHARHCSLGMHPLFWRERANGIALATSPLDLLEDGTQLDYPALAVFLRLGFFVGEDTPFAGVRQLAPGSELSWDVARGARLRTAPLPRGDRLLLDRDAAMDRYGALLRQAVANFFLEFDKTLAYLAIDFPQPLASLIRTTNLLERFHKEMRRKQRDIGMFQSEQGCEVLWYLVSMRETAKQRAAVQT